MFVFDLARTRNQRGQDCSIYVGTKVGSWYRAGLMARSKGSEQKYAISEAVPIVRHENLGQFEEKFS